MSGATMDQLASLHLTTATLMAKLVLKWQLTARDMAMIKAHRQVVDRPTKCAANAVEDDRLSASG